VQQLSLPYQRAMKRRQSRQRWEQPLLLWAATIAMAVGFQRDNVDLQFVESYAWIPSFGINFSLGVDAIALVLILMSTILAPIVVLAGWDEAHGGRWSVKTFYILILVLETMMIGVFAATDLFLFYVIFEAMLIPVYFLIGGYGTGERAAAAVKFLLYSLFGGLLMLASIIALYVMSGNQGGHTFDIDKLSQLEMSSTTQNLLFLGFFIAFAIKAPLWPFHTLVARCSQVSNTRYIGFYFLVCSTRLVPSE
jgi:NADH-quinone oxidoreductase subunit M